MNKSLLWGLIILVVVAGLWFGIRHPAVTTDTEFKQPLSLKEKGASRGQFGFLLKDYDVIRLQRWQPRKTMLTFARVGDVWKVGEGELPDRLYKLDQERFSKVLDNLKTFRLKPKEVSENPENRIKYGVDVPLHGEMDVDEDSMSGKEITEWRKKYRGMFTGVEVSFYRDAVKDGKVVDGEKLGSMVIGRPDNLHGPDMDMRENRNPSFYVRLSDGNPVFELEDDFGFLLIGRDLRSWRDKNIINIANTDSIESIDVKSDLGDFLLERVVKQMDKATETDSSGTGSVSGEIWRITDRMIGKTIEGEDVDEKSVDSYINRIARWKTYDFASEDELAKLSFDEKIGKTDSGITVTMKNGHVIETKVVPGPPKKPRYKKDAKAEPEEYYIVNTAYPDVVFKLRKWSVKSLFDKKLDDFISATKDEG